jgi:hypothetical protein
MSNISKNTEIKFLLNGIQYNAPVEWQDIEIVADYVNDNIQPSLSTSEYIFPLEARKAVLNWFNGPLGGFEGMPFELILYNNLAQQESFKSFLDFTENYQELLQDGRILINTIQEDGIDDFYSKLGSVTFGHLEAIGAVNSSDYVTVPYVVEKKFNLFEILMTSIILYLMIKELAESIERTADAIAEASGIAAAGFTGTIGAAILLVAKAIIAIAYTAVLLFAIIDLATTLINTLVPPKREHKAILLRRALEIVCNHLGYGLVMPEADFDFVHYLPSNPRQDDKTFFGFISVTKGTPTGIPYINDYGYNCEEMFKLAKDLIQGRIAIIGSDVHIRPDNDPFWLQQSTWSMPSVLLQGKGYNLNELNSTKIIEFSFDFNDEWTIDNSEGTAYEIKTSPVTVQNQKAVLLKGLERLTLPVALGNRKDELNAIENLIKSVANFIDGVTGVFGGGTNFAAKVNAKKGVLKQTQNWHSIPKLLYLKGGKLPINQRDLWSAKHLYDSFLNYNSFVANNWQGQKAVYNNVEIPFGIEDYKQLTVNPYFLFEGAVAKITNFTWTTGRDKATISFWVRERYTTNLKETFINPE